MRGKQSGFTIIELLVTLIVAALFVIAGYQLYTVVLHTDGQTRAQTIAQNTAQDYLERYRASVPSPCAASTPLTNSPITVTGLVNVQISVNVSCPKSSSGSLANLSKIDVTLSYNRPTTTLSYSAWSYAPDVCGAGWILVPGDSRFDTPNFCVMKYDAKNVNGQAISQAAGTPWVNINQNDAVAVSAAACPTCHLISESEWMTIAANVLNVPSNWSGGTVGSGYIYRGHSDSSPANSLAASTDDTNGYYGTGNSASSGTDQRRTLNLSNGEVIWDLAGNVYEWTNYVMPGNQQPGLSGESSYAYKEWNNASIIWNGFPYASRASNITQAAGWTSANGIGELYSNAAETGTHGFMRGSAWYSGTGGSGVLNLIINDPITYTGTSVGFRVAKSIDDQPEQLAQPSSCPTGFIPVPGDARFGTAGFCVMKYEAKIQGNDNGNQTYSSSFVPESRASGTPWVNITQPQAEAESQSLCAGCHLISNDEWMTIAANVISVPSNWSGGAVGSGYIYQGHVNNNPSTPLAASTNDSAGTTGMTGGFGGVGGNSSRTLTLTNGQVIWDMSGNVWDLTSGTVDPNQNPGITGEATWAWKEWTNPNIVWNGLSLLAIPDTISPQVGSWSSTSGIGELISWTGYTGTSIMFRGGGYGEQTPGGILSLNLAGSTGAQNGGIGFRVAK